MAVHVPITAQMPEEAPSFGLRELLPESRRDVSDRRDGLAPVPTTRHRRVGHTSHDREQRADRPDTCHGSGEVVDRLGRMKLRLR